MATRYWIGGDGNWSDTSHWSTSSGGSGGASVPTSTDDIVLDSNSGSGEIQMDVEGSCHDITCSGGGVDLDLLSNDLNCYGSIDGTGGADGQIRSGTLNMLATTSETIDAKTNGRLIGGTIVFNGAGGTWTLQNPLGGSASVLPSVTLLQGTLTTNNEALRANDLTESGSGTKTLNLGSSSVIVIGTAGLSFSGTNFTFNEGTSSIELTSSTADLHGNGETFYDVEFDPISDSSVPHEITGANTFNNLILGDGSHGSDIVVSVYEIQDNQTVSGTFTVTGGIATKRNLVTGITVENAGEPVWLYSSTAGSKTITAAVVSLTNVDFMNITGAGAAAPFTGTKIGDRGGLGGITPDTAGTRYWVGDGGNWNDTSHWSTSSGGSSGAAIPMPQDNVVFDASSFTTGSQTVTASGVVIGGNDLTISGVTNSPTFEMSSNQRPGASFLRWVPFLGDVSLDSGATYGTTFGFNVCMQSISAATLTSNGTDFNSDPTTFYVVTKESVTLGDTLNGSLDWRGGDFDAVTYSNISSNLTLFDNSEGSIGGSFLMGTGTWQILSSLSIKDSASAFDAETSTILLGGAGSDSSVFFNISTYGYVNLYNLIIRGSNSATVKNLSIGNSTPFDDRTTMWTANSVIFDQPSMTVTFDNPYTYRMTDLTVTGNATYSVLIRSQGVGSNDNVYFHSVNAPTITYCDVSDNFALGNIPFDATDGTSTDSGSNTNWDFGSLELDNVVKINSVL